MTQSGRKVVLREWERREAPATPELCDLWLEEDAVSKRLRAGNLLHVRDNRKGSVLEARQHVGVLQLGPLQVVIQPKLPSDDLWYILAYGLGLDSLPWRAPAELLLQEASFADLLALALLTEAETLWRRGPRRGYPMREEWLASPRGKIHMARLAASAPLTKAALPCVHHPLSADTLENRVVRAGLRLASQVAQTPPIRAMLAQAERRWGEVCGPLRLQALHLRQVKQARTRLTAAYAPAHQLVTLLYEGMGLPDDLEKVGPKGARLPGFLWNMALLFERFVSRFLEEHAHGVAVHRQRSLEQLYRIISAEPGMRPSPPRPRPDLIIERNQKVVAVLDTKYRDLGREGLPRDMLYQLSVYSVAYASEEGVAPPPPVIALYPQQDGPRADITYGFRHDSSGAEGRIILRAIDWSSASRALREPRQHAELPHIAAAWLSAE